MSPFRSSVAVNSRTVHCERRLAGPRRHRIKPHPRSRNRHGPALAKAISSTLRRKLVSVPARIASSGRRIRVRLPEAWPWEAAWSALFAHAVPPREADQPVHPATRAPTETISGTPRAARPTAPSAAHQRAQQTSDPPHPEHRWIQVDGARHSTFVEGRRLMLLD